jgi:hypothetical protein
MLTSMKLHESSWRTVLFSAQVRAVILPTNSILTSIATLHCLDNNNRTTRLMISLMVSMRETKNDDIDDLTRKSLKAVNLHSAERPNAA